MTRQSAVMQNAIHHRCLKWIPIGLIFLSSSIQINALSVIDLLIVYSPEAGLAGNGSEAMQQLAMAAVREMNAAHERSVSDVRFHLVGWFNQRKTKPALPHPPTCGPFAKHRMELWTKSRDYGIFTARTSSPISSTTTAVPMLAWRTA